MLTKHGKYYFKKNMCIQHCKYHFKNKSSDSYKFLYKQIDVA